MIVQDEVSPRFLPQSDETSSSNASSNRKRPLSYVILTSSFMGNSSYFKDKQRMLKTSILIEILIMILTVKT
jgi:hypothetical protein